MTVSHQGVDTQEEEAHGMISGLRSSGSLLVLFSFWLSFAPNAFRVEVVSLIQGANWKKSACTPG